MATPAELILSGISCVLMLMIAFLLRQVQKLVDKCMSKTHAEYAQAQGYLKNTPRDEIQIQPDSVVDTDLAIMREYTG